MSIPTRNGQDVDLSTYILTNPADYTEALEKLLLQTNANVEKQAKKSLQELVKEEAKQRSLLNKQTIDNLIKAEETNLKTARIKHENEMQQLRLTNEITIQRKSQEYRQQREKLDFEHEQELAVLKETLSDRIVAVQRDKQFENEKAIYDAKIKYGAAGVAYTANLEKAQRAKQQKDQLADAKKLSKEKWQTEKEYAKDLLKNQYNNLLSRTDENGNEQSIGESLKDTFKQVGSILKENFQEVFEEATTALFNATDAAVDKVMSTFTQYQSQVNARIQGTKDTFTTLQDRLTSAVGITPYFKTEDLLKNLNATVENGIAYDIEQRAFLQTVSDKIATTFDAFESSLTRIIRIQQSDSTAARLGLEAYLTRYLNANFADTSYLNGLYDQVQGNILEAMSLQGTTDAVSFEYQIQKWLGSLYSVGFSDSTISALSQALGNLGSGNVSALNGTAMQNLLVMAAANSGLDYGQLLINGLNESNVNTLLESVVTYLQDIAQNNNQVVLSQYADVFGVQVSDLVAALNINTEAIKESTLNYSQTIDELGGQLNSLASRMTIPQMLENVFANAQFSLGQGIAENPALYAIYKITSLIQSHTGGINIPFISAMGTGVDLNTTVENLVKLGVIGVSSLGMIGDVIGGLGSTLNPASMLTKLGIGNTPGILQNIQFSGLGTLSQSSGSTTSSTTTLGNASGEDIYESTMNEAKSETSAELDQAKENEIGVPDLYNYFTQTFDRKFDTMLHIVGKSNGYKFTSVGSMTWDEIAKTNPLTQLGAVITSGTNNVIVQQDAQAITNAQIMSQIQDSVLEINRNVTSMASNIQAIANGYATLRVTGVY